jgi:hypothetical protein
LRAKSIQAQVPCFGRYRSKEEQQKYRTKYDLEEQSIFDLLNQGGLAL